MTPGILMLISAVVLIVAFLAVGVNFVKFFKDPSRLLEGKGVMFHLIGGMIASLATFALIGGFIWFLVEKLA
jgi:hypothetical protein